MGVSLLNFFDLKPLNTSKRALNTNHPFFGTPCIYFTFAQKVNLDIDFRFTLKIDLKSRHYLPVKKQTRADVIEKSICLKSIENILEKWRKFTRGPSTTPL